MQTTLNLKPTSKPIKQYYETMGEKRQMGFQVEGNVAPAFADLLGNCAKSLGYRFNEQHAVKLRTGRNIRLDGAILTQFHLRYGVWEAKDSKDDLKTEIRKKFEAGYPNDNILFQSPDRAVLIQNGREVLDVSLADPKNLIEVLNAFFSYTQPALEAWERAVSEFKGRVPEVARGLDLLIEEEYQKNGTYKRAFDSFLGLCQTAINPQLSKDAVEEMLIQHILTERIFRRVFNNDKFARQNAIASEIETVIDALTSKRFSRDDFTRSLDHFYGAIEQTASTIASYDEKQDFLNTVYENFFQGFSVKTADTHGIVYTPQSIVQFMVKSVEALLQREFQRSLADEGVHILDPFVGTGNFLLRVMEEIKQKKPSALAHKYAQELHCNEVMLLPYYIASMNLEHAYYEAMGEYAPFEGICLVDTFELAEERQMPMFVEQNTARVERQRQQELTVILGNPPYNAGQVNENDNNKNRKYRVLDKRVQDTYVKASKATNRNSLSDPYVKAFRWASDRLKTEGVVAFVTNNSFVDNIAFDGMREHLQKDFDAIYVLDLGGNSRLTGRGEKVSNVFGIRVGVCITFLVRKSGEQASRKGTVYYRQVQETGKKEDKFAFLEEAHTLEGVEWQVLTPNRKFQWLTEGLETDFEGLLPLGTKEAKASKLGSNAIFQVYSNGTKSNNDAYVYRFQRDALVTHAQNMVHDYRTQLARYLFEKRPKNIEGFLNVDESVLKWIRNTKRTLQRGKEIQFDDKKIRQSLYRPFNKQFYYFERAFNEECYQFPRIFPTPETEAENRVICFSDIGYRASTFSCLMTNVIPDLHLCASVDAHQTFPLYVYDEAGASRRENVSDWALEAFQAHYADLTLTKEALFYYIYGALHQPSYRLRYAQNLKRELPRIGFLPDFWQVSRIGRQLADLHVSYETLSPYPLVERENSAVPPSYRVENKMTLSKDKTALTVNPFLTLVGIPQEVFGYQLGNRSALEWVIEQYQVKTDKRSGITNDPNRLDDERYIVRLVGQVVRVSLETVALIRQLEGEERP